MTAPGTALLLLGAVYAGTLGAFALGFRRVLRARAPATPQEPPFVSVIVPARDEAAVIARCLNTLLACDYPPERFEVIVVDDLSEDDTPAVVERVRRHVNAPVPAGSVAFEPPERLRFLRMPENLQRTRAHKKRAIEKGITHARGALILTTDADCTVPRGWLRAMSAPFGNLEGDPGPGR